MQNTMLDSIVPSNSQELFDFHAVHNGEACIESLDPKDRGTERQFRFTRALLCTILGVKSEDTITAHVDKLLKRGVVTETRNLVSVMLSDSLGRECIKTTLYDLKVFNYLVMRLDTDRAWEMKAKFNDVLVERETGGCGIRTVDDMINDPDTAIRLLTQLKILRLQNDQLAMERDEAIRTKAMIGSNREATAMNTASQKSKECAKLTAENAELKDAVGRGMNWRTVNMMTAEWKREFGHAPSYHKLKLFSADLPEDMQPIKDVEVKAVLKNGSEKVSLVNRYHREAWAKYREYEENSRVRGKNVPDTKILGLRVTDTDLEVF